MRDAIFLAVIVGFFAIATAYVRACTRIIGPDDISTETEHESDLYETADSEVTSG